MTARTTLDRVDVALLEALDRHPRAGDLVLSRVTGVARATVQNRLGKMAAAGVIVGWGPTLDAAAAGYEVQAFVTLEIAQGALEEVARDLDGIPQVLEAYVTTGAHDVMCRVATRSHPELQSTLVLINQSPSVVRSTSVMVLSVLVGQRLLPLLRSSEPPPNRRTPAYRDTGSAPE